MIKKPAKKLTVKAATKKLVSKVNWEKLAKNLQIALAKEMKENEALELENAKLVAEMYKHQGVIMYLHGQLKYGNDPV